MLKISNIKFLNRIKKNKNRVLGPKSIIYLDVDSFAFLTRDVELNWLKRHRLHRQYKRIMKKTDKVVVPTLEVARQVQRYYYVPKAKITIIQK